MANYQIKKDLIPGLPRKPYRHGIGKPEGIVLHETGAWGGSAQSNRDFEARTWENAFVHYFVDWNSIVQVSDPDYVAWGCGHTGNQRFVQIELVRTKDKEKFRQSYDRYVWLITKMLHRYGLKPERMRGLWTHHDVTRQLGGTTHTDPDAYLGYHGVTVPLLIKDIADAYYGTQKLLKEEDEMLKNAVVIGSFADFPNAEPLANQLDAPIYMRDTAEKEQVAEKIYVCGGQKEGLKGSNFVDLSGHNRYATAENIKEYLDTH